MSPRPLQPTRRGILQGIGSLALLAFLAIASSVGAQPAPPGVAEKTPRDGSVWGGLIYASDQVPLEWHPVTTEFPDLAHRMSRVFPYRYFDLLGEHNEALYREHESWVVPTKFFFLKLASKGEAPYGGILVQLQFWQGPQILVRSDVVLRPGSPLFIAGPRWRRGRIIFVLALHKAEPRSAHP